MLLEAWARCRRRKISAYTIVVINTMPIAMLNPIIAFVSSDIFRGFSGVSVVGLKKSFEPHFTGISYACTPVAVIVTVSPFGLVASTGTGATKA